MERETEPEEEATTRHRYSSCNNHSRWGTPYHRAKMPMCSEHKSIGTELRASAYQRHSARTILQQGCQMARGSPQHCARILHHGQGRIARPLDPLATPVGRTQRCSSIGHPRKRIRLRVADLDVPM